MPTFRFHFVENSVVAQPISAQLANVDAAKCEAAHTIGSMICDAGAGAWQGGDWNVSVSDEDGLMLFALYVAPIDAPAVSTLSASAGRSARVGGQSA